LTGFFKKKIGKYKLGLDHLVTGADGRSFITSQDYAEILVKEIETPAHIRQRFTAAAL
jgi:uncharacterized protein